jgi:hypothetical protein
MKRGRIAISTSTPRISTESRAFRVAGEQADQPAGGMAISVASPASATTLRRPEHPQSTSRPRPSRPSGRRRSAS